MNKRKIFSTKINVLVNHLNYGNHLGYDSLLSILQEARLRWLKTIKRGITEINIEDGVGWLVKDVHLTYEAEAHHGDELLIELFVSETTKTTFTIEYAVTNQTSEKQVCYATTNLVCFNFGRSKVARIPSCLIIALESDPMLGPVKTHS